MDTRFCKAGESGCVAPLQSLLAVLEQFLLWPVLLGVTVLVQRLSLLAVCLRQVLVVASCCRVESQSPLHRQFVVVVIAVEALLNLLQSRLLFLVVQSPQSRGLF